MNALRVVRDDGFGARENVALTAAMVELREANEIPDTLRIYRYPKSVLLGRNQVAETACDLLECKRRDIEIARRLTGGGAIYMDAGVVTWDLVIARNAGMNILSLSSDVCTSIADGLAEFGIAARFRADNDIEIGGRKVGGASGYGDGAVLVYQGSLLVAPDFDAMDTVLKLKNVRETATSFAIEAGSISQSVFGTNVSHSISRAITRRTFDDALSSRERERASMLLAREFGRDDFVFSGEARVAA